MVDVDTVLSELAVTRPLFHSEADFQHAFAWRLHERDPELRVRLEYRTPFLGDRMYLDVWATKGDAAVALELKYKTRRLSASVAGERFELVDQSAQDLGRYDAIKDICRLEKLTRAAPHVSAFSILLTNDSAYWTAPRGNNTVDAGFRLHEGHVLCGECVWGLAASTGTTRTREAALRLSGHYSIRWREYSQVSPDRHGVFRYLALPVVVRG
jgi:hypothetical protein